jgi:hypothetical protein
MPPGTQHLQLQVESFTASELRGIEPPPPRTMRRIGGFHDVQQHERMTADLPPWRKRTRVAGRILSLNGTAGSMLDARWTW